MNYSTMPRTPHKSKCYAKTMNDRPACTVDEHCLYVGMIARAIWRRLPPSIQLKIPAGAITLAACHDIGKLSPGFLNKIYKALYETNPDFGQDDPDVSALLKCSPDCFETNHAVTGMRSLFDLKLTHKGWSNLIGKHHGTPHDNPKEKADNDIFGGKGWQEARQQLVEQLIQKFGSLPDEKPSFEQLDLTLALIVFADWLGSDERFLVNGQVPTESDMELHVEKILDNIEWIPPKPFQDKTSFASLFGEDFVPNEVQRRFFEVADKPGIFVIEAPMGLGKTEAALWGALRLIQKGFHRGIYFALPTRTTSDKIHERMELFLDNAFDNQPSVRLIHGTAWMRMLRLTDERFQEKHKRKIHSEQSEQDESDLTVENDRCVGSLWFQGSKRGLLQPFGVGTIDQALLGVIPNVKHSFLRLFGLAGKVVILDEVHSYDIYTGTLLKHLVQRLGKLGASVIILSATLTRERREQLLAESANNDGKEYGEQNDWRNTDKTKDEFQNKDVSILSEPYPLISYRYYSDKMVRYDKTNPAPDHIVYLTHRTRDDSTLPSLVAERAMAGQLVLCVMNTVDKAQCFYKKVKSELKEDFDLERVGLLHSRFPLWRREELENKWLNIYGKNGDRSKGAVLVATQIVEQSVDIDVDLLVTELAPADMLFQRMGRLWRHQRKERKAKKPETILLHPPLRNESYVKRLESDAWVYAPYVLARSEDEWSKLDKISLPSQIRDILEAVYEDRDETQETQEYREMYRKLQEKRKQLKRRAESATLDQNLPIASNDDCQTRYSDSQSLEIVLFKQVSYNDKNKVDAILSSGDVPNLCSQRSGHTAVQIRQNSLSLRKNSRYPIASRNRSLDLSLGQYFFSEFAPLIVDEETGRLKTLDGENTDYSYSNDLGVFIECSQNKNSDTTTFTYQQTKDDENECPEEFEW